MQISETKFNNDHIADVIDDMTDEEMRDIFNTLFCKEAVYTEWDRQREHLYDRVRTHVENIDYTPDHKDAA